MVKNPAPFSPVDYFENEDHMFIQRAVRIKYTTVGSRLPTQRPQSFLLYDDITLVGGIFRE